MKFETLEFERGRLRIEKTYRSWSEVSVYVFPTSDVIVVGMLKSAVLSPTENRMVVRARSPPEASRRVL